MVDDWRIGTWTALVLVVLASFVCAACSTKAEKADPPDADFEVEMDASALFKILETGSPAQLRDLSSGAPSQWEWDFDSDGVVDSTEREPQWVPSHPGPHLITLRVRNRHGESSVTKEYLAASPVHGIPFYFNLDDDDTNGVEDYKQSQKTGADVLDLAPVILRHMRNAPTGGRALVQVGESARGRVRIHQHDPELDEWNAVYASGAGFEVPLTLLAQGDVRLGVEATERLSAQWDGYLSLTLRVEHNDGWLHSEDTALLRCAPPIYVTNLWEALELHIVSISGGFTNNTAFRNACANVTNAAGITLRMANGATYSSDRWIQDSSEPAVVLLPQAGSENVRVIQHVMQCNRFRPVDQWCRDFLLGPDFDFHARFLTVAQSHSFNYGGNIEVIPPLPGHPWGRMLLGGGTGFKIGTSQTTSGAVSPAYKQHFDATVQGPFVEATTEWLAVGHIDEYTMIVPAPARPRGWVCLIASPDLGYQILEQVQAAGGGNALVFEGRTTYGWQTTVNAILNDTYLRAINAEVQQRVNLGRNQIKAATGLTDDDFVELPCLFEDIGSNWIASYNPGVVNLITLPAADGSTHLIVPDPEGPKVPEDAWKVNIKATLSALGTAANPVHVTYADVFYSYHDLLGEAHCGANTVRKPPPGNWWGQ
jgi:protein-arginine deiminase